MNKALEELLLDLYFAGEASTRCCGRAEEVAATKERDALMEKIATFVLPEEGWTKDQLRAVLEGLECERIDILMTQSPPTLRAVAEQIALAAKLGADLYRSKPQVESPK